MHDNDIGTNKHNDSEILTNPNAALAYQQQIAQLYEKMTEAFKKIDTDVDGFIDEKEFFNFLESNIPRGKTLNKSFFKQTFEELDKNNDGRISS
jgi:Ca2+-binding EF-hand superfamily protein